MCLSSKRRAAAVTGLRSRAMLPTGADRLRVDDLRVFYSVIGTDVIVQGIVSKEGANQWLKEREKK